MNPKVKRLTTAAVLLAICIVSQFFKNTSVFIAGPVINTCIIICVMACGLPWAILLSLVTPVTAFIITGAPVMKVIPGIMPLIMVGNALLALGVWIIARKKKTSKNLLIGSCIGSVIKAVFMALTISYGLLLTTALPEKMAPMLPKLQFTYSVVQLITALVGTAFAAVIWIPLNKSADNPE
ncbi:MAG: ECF transporter S component [Lachnospiraceae bacterium]